MTTQAEAAASGMYWFIPWTGGDIALFSALDGAERAAFEECQRHVHETGEAINGLEIVVFKGRDAESSVRIYARLQLGGFAWSPPEWPAGVITLSPEEAAHLIRRRIRSQRNQE